MKVAKSSRARRADGTARDVGYLNDTGIAGNAFYGDAHTIKRSSLQFPIAETRYEVIVHQSDGLHEGITNRRADEGEAALGEILAHRIGLRSASRHLLQSPPAVLELPAARESPNVSVEAAELLLHGEKGLGIPETPHMAGRWSVV